VPFLVQAPARPAAGGMKLTAFSQQVSEQYRYRYIDIDMHIDIYIDVYSGGGI